MGRFLFPRIRVRRPIPSGNARSVCHLPARVESRPAGEAVAGHDSDPNPRRSGLTRPGAGFRFDRQRVLVVGDLILDEYVTGDCSRISPEAPVPILKFGSFRSVPGGAANTAANPAAKTAVCLKLPMTYPVEGAPLVEVENYQTGGSWPRKTGIFLRLSGHRQR